MCVTTAGDSVVRETNEMQRKKGFKSVRKHFRSLMETHHHALSVTTCEKMLKTHLASSTMSGKCMDDQHCGRFYKENSAPCGCCCRTTPVSIFPSTAAGPSSTRLLICRNSSGSSPPTTVKPKPRRLFFSFVLMKVPFSSAGFLVKKGFPPAADRQKKTCFQQTHGEQAVSQTHEHEESAEGNLFTFGSCRAGR